MQLNLKNHLRGDWQIWSILLVLSLLSIAVVYSSSSALAFRNAGGNTEYYLLRHSVHITLGLVITYLVHKYNYTNFAGISKLLLWTMPFLLLYTLKFGVNVGGAKRWVSILGMTFQTSDIIRLVLITNLAAMLAKRQNVAYNRNTIYGLIIWCGGLCGLLAVSNFSTAAILGFTCFMIMWIGRVPTKYLLGMAASVISMLILAIGVSIFLQKQGIEFGRGRTVVERTESFVSKDLDGDGFIGNKHRNDKLQREAALIAIARGGPKGLGPGKSFQRNTLPEAFSDYIYAIIIEEYGMLGGFGVMVLYLWLLYRGLKNIELTDRAFGGLLSVGLSLSIVFQAFAHMFINVGLGPVTGQTLPLISMGGTSILFTSIAIGIILSVSRGEYDEKQLLRKG